MCCLAHVGVHVHVPQALATALPPPSTRGHAAVPGSGVLGEEGEVTVGAAPVATDVAPVTVADAAVGVGEVDTVGEGLSEGALVTAEDLVGNGLDGEYEEPVVRVTDMVTRYTSAGPVQVDREAVSTARHMLTRYSSPLHT